jgi:hypothetical protein
LQGNTTFTHIDLSESYMGDEGCKAICQALQQPDIKIRSLILRGSNVHVNGAAAIGQLLKINRTIEKYVFLEENP